MKRSMLMLSLAAQVLGGCTTANLATPTGFAAHEPGESYQYRASDGEGIVLAVRAEKNQPRGDLAFWTSALDVQLRKAGYEAQTYEDVTSADGHAGRQLRYVLDDGGREISFWVTLFVTARKVVVVEAGGDREFFAPKVDVVEQAIASLELG